MTIAEDTRERDYCPKCNHIQTVKVGRYCPDCGTELTEKPETVKCQACGNDVKERDSFCPACGSPNCQKKV
jgi:rRNA maturation endonuclease Nob1